MITVKIADLVNSVDTLQKLSQKSFKAKLAWSISRLLKAAETEIQSFNETRMDLIRRRGEKDENGELITDENGNCKINPAEINEFSKELNDLLETTVEINVNRIRMDLLEDLDFTPMDMAVLEPFVEFDDE